MHRRAFLQSAGLFAIGAQIAHPAAGAEPPNPVALTISIRVKPGREAEFLDLLHPVLDAMRHEPTFINAVLLRDPEDAGHFLLYETWADLEDVRDVQLHRPYRQTYGERLPDLIAGEREIALWQPLREDRAACIGPR